MQYGMWLLNSREAIRRWNPGMITSNEPGVYLENKFGIRLENLILCCEAEQTDFGRFFGI